MKLFFSGHQPYVCRFLKVLPLKIFGSAIFLRKWYKFFPRPSGKNFPGQRNLQKFPQKFHLQPRKLRMGFKVSNHHSFGRARRAISVCRHLGPDSSSKNPRCWLMISSSLQGFRYQQLFQDLSWRYMVTGKMGTTTSIKYLYFWYLKSLD